MIYDHLKSLPSRVSNQPVFKIFGESGICAPVVAATAHKLASSTVLHGRATHICTIFLLLFQARRILDYCLL